jgi:Bifunctional DNA primase/polymerase, N-terminal
MYFLARQRLRRAALQLAARGWPVTPGASLRAGRFDCGRPGCPTTTCHPALDGWEQAASRDRERVEDWWRYAPHSVLLATGVAFDVLEVSAPLGSLAVASPRWSGRVRGPVATMPTGRWMFLVAPGGPMVPELAGRLDVVRHSRGSWVPAPPTRLVEGAVRWLVPPAEVRWQLPEGYKVQRLLTDVLPSIAPRVRPPQAPRLDRAA